MQAAAHEPPRVPQAGRRFGPVTRFGDLWLLTPPSVFAPRSDAQVLLDAAAGRVRGRVLDLCTGSGVLALSVRPFADEVTAVDASRATVLAARVNAVINRRPIEVLHGDLFGPVAGRLFDTIISNPPYLPVAGGHDRRVGARAWNGGADGRSVIDRICRNAVGHLASGGELLLVQSSLTRVGPTLQLLEASGLRPSVEASYPGRLGSLARAQLDHLRALGVAAPDGAEQIVVVSGRAAISG